MEGVAILFAEKCRLSSPMANFRRNTMANELIDLTQMRPAAADLWSFGKADVILLATTGGVGYLAKEAFKYFFPGSPSVTEQLAVLTKLIEASGRSGVTSLKVRISTDAKFALQLPEAVADARVTHETPTSVDLEVLFRPTRRRARRPTA